MSEVRIKAEPRSTFGKGSARQARFAGQVPAVLYGHGEQPRHLVLPEHDLSIALKTSNVLLAITGLGGTVLALPKAIDRHPVSHGLQHVDLVIVKRGETVSVEIPLVTVGEVAGGSMLDLVHTSVAVKALATAIPAQIEISVEGLEPGSHVTAADLVLPEGVELELEPDALLVTVYTTSSAEAEAEAADEAAESTDEA